MKRGWKSNWLKVFVSRSWMSMVGCCVLASLGTVAAEVEQAKVEVDCAQGLRPIKGLHGANGGPILFGGMLDLSKRFSELGFPLLRLHDCQWPEPAVVDIHTIFRDFRDEPGDPSNFYFARTDDYLDSIVKTGSGVLYRLGESIEHTQRKYDVHPPRDYAKWAAICLGVIRHYNEGWASGFHHDIKYWEVWNEPDVRPQMWSGSDEDYFRLYSTTVAAIKSEFPNLKVGGPAVGNVGSLRDGRFEPSPFVVGFLAHCRDHRLPLDFFSWHRYTDNPIELTQLARGVRGTLNKFGFEKTESHLNEWNYLPRNDWSIFANGTPEQREQWYAEMAGPSGAAFVVSALIGLQDAPLDMACYFTSGTDGFGLFNAQGRPNKVFHAFKSFRELLDTPGRVAASVSDSSVQVCAGINSERSKLNLLLAYSNAQGKRVRLEITNFKTIRPVHLRRVSIDARHDWDETKTTVADPSAISIYLEGPTVTLLTVSQ